MRDKITAGVLTLRVVDLRDDPGHEKMAGKTAALAAALGKGEYDLTSPFTISGHDLRDDDRAWQRVERAMLEAINMRRDYLRAGRAANVRGTMGGSVKSLPIAISVHNYGVSVVCDRTQDRTLWFREGR